MADSLDYEDEMSPASRQNTPGDTVHIELHGSGYRTFDDTFGTGSPSAEDDDAYFKTPAVSLPPQTKPKQAKISHSSPRPDSDGIDHKMNAARIADIAYTLTMLREMTGNQNPVATLHLYQAIHSIDSQMLESMLIPYLKEIDKLETQIYRMSAGQDESVGPQYGTPPVLLRPSVPTNPVLGMETSQPRMQYSHRPHHVNFAPNQVLPRVPLHGFRPSSMTGLRHPTDFRPNNASALTHVNPSHSVAASIWTQSSMGYAPTHVNPCHSVAAPTETKTLYTTAGVATSTLPVSSGYTLAGPPPVNNWNLPRMHQAPPPLNPHVIPPQITPVSSIPSEPATYHSHSSPYYPSGPVMKGEFEDLRKLVLDMKKASVSEDENIPPGWFRPRTTAWSADEMRLGEKDGITHRYIDGIKYACTRAELLESIREAEREKESPPPLQEDKVRNLIGETPPPDELSEDELRRNRRKWYGDERDDHVKTVKDFFSTSWEEWEKWYNRFKTCKSRCRWNPLQAVNQLRSRLSGPVNGTVCKAEVIGGRLTSITDLENIVKYHLLGYNDRAKARDLFMRRTKQTSEDLAGYGRSLLELARIAFPHTNFEYEACKKFAETASPLSPVQDALRIYMQGYGQPSMSIMIDDASQRVAGLTPEPGYGNTMRYYCTDEVQSSHQESLPIYQFHASHPQKQNEQRKFSRRKQSHRQRYDDKKDTSVQSPRRNQSPSRYKDITENSQKKGHSKAMFFPENACYTCRGVGHYSNACPTKYICSNCKGIGHESSLCTSPKSEAEHRYPAGRNERKQSTRKNFPQKVATVKTFDLKTEPQELMEDLRYDEEVPSCSDTSGSDEYED
jgi:hypothetical protein